MIGKEEEEGGGGVRFHLLFEYTGLACGLAADLTKGKE